MLIRALRYVQFRRTLYERPNRAALTIGMSARPHAKPRYEVAVPDQFDLLTAEAGTRAQAPAGVASWASRPPRIAGDVVAGSALTSCRVGDA